MMVSPRLIVSIATSSLALLGGLRAEALLSRHPYPQMASQESVAILWRTTGGSVPIVRYGSDPEQLDQEILPVQIVVRLGPDIEGPVGLSRLHSAPPDTYQYEASIFGLQPGTSYYYGIFDGDRLLAGGDEEHSFTTLPEANSTGPLRLWVVGDSGNGSAAQIAGFDAMRNFVAADGKPIDAYLHLGDMAYNVGLDGEFSANFFDIYTDLLRNTVVWPTMGNHEGYTSNGILQRGPYYDAYAVPTQGEAGGVPSGTEAYYAFDIGRVHFICLESHDLDRSSTGEMALWLKSDLEMVDADWLIAFWHHPPYTKGSHDSDREAQLIEMREIIMPILESGGVDLVLGGHSHIYERSMLIDGAYATPTVADGVILDDGDGDPSGNGAYRKSGALNPNEGTVALVAGHGRSAANFYGISPIMRSTIAEVGSVIIDIDGDTLTGKMINASGEVRDEFQLIKQGEIVPEIVDFPWQLSGPEFRTERLEPGQTFIEIDPVPAAPDAVIYYTLDGSLPTTGSPIYDAPIPVSDTTRVRAFSTWKGGERTSLISESVPIQPYLSIQKFLSDPMDDGRQDMGGEMYLNEPSLGLGDGGIVGLRFDNLRITPDAFIVRAQLQFQKTVGSFVSTDGEIWGELVADSPPFTGLAMDFSERESSVSRIPWRPLSWTMTYPRDHQSETSDIRELVNEVVALPGWQSGNAMSFFLTQEMNRVVEAYDSGPGRSAALIVTYIDPDGLAERIASEPLGIGPRNGFEHSISFRWPDDEAAAALGLSYEIEGSPDLGSWTPTEILEVTPGGFQFDGFRSMSAIIAPAALLGEGQYYFRLRVSQSPPAP